MTGVTAGSSASSPVCLPVAEGALAVLTLTTVLGFWRVFDRSTFLVPMLAVASISHLLMVIGRRRAWSVLVTAGVSAPTAALLCAWLVFPDTTMAGLPTGETVAAIGAELRDALHQFSNILAPAPPEPGFVVASCLALYFAVFLADWAAFRLWSSFEAVVPASTLFIFCALLGAEHKQVSAVLFLTALLIFLLLHRAARQESSAGWLVGDHPVTGGASRLGSLLAVGTSLVAVAVIGGTLATPHLPSAGAPPLVPWRSGNQGTGERKAVSPLVRIRDQLLTQPDVPLFTVRSNEPAYWRLTSLETFDGDIWRSRAPFEAADGKLPGDAPAGETDRLDQTFTITNLDMLWAPTAFRPANLVDSTVELNFNADSSTLIVADDSTIQGARYTIQSEHTRPTAEALRSVRAEDTPEEIAGRYLDLPDDFSDLARGTARSLTSDKARPYDKARALQDFFRDPRPDGFTYDTEFAMGHSEDAIDAFLTERQGFCEQFAGTYAAMARSIGLPARVAVGFTQGVNRDPKSPDLYEVSGRQTHAWPEVYLGRFGWVMFEPTPSRGAPNTPWTGVSVQQDVGSAVPTTTPVVPGSGPPGTAAPLGVDPAPPTTEGVPPTTSTTPAEHEAPTERNPIVSLLVLAARATRAVLIVGFGAAALLAAYLAVLATIRHRRSSERRIRATDASRLVSVAWAECLDALRPLGLVPAATESHDEFAHRVAPRLGAAGPGLLALADAVNHADYAQDLVGEDIAAQASAAARRIAEAAAELATTSQVWLARLDPRPLLGNRHRAPHHTITQGGRPPR